MRKATGYPPELRERAIRLVREHRDEHPSESAAIQSIAGKLGITPETLRLWVRRDEIDHGKRPGVTSAERERIHELGGRLEMDSDSHGTQILVKIPRAERRNVFEVSAD